MMSNQEVHFLEDAPPQDFTRTTLQLGEDKSSGGNGVTPNSNVQNAAQDSLKSKRDVALVPWSGEDARDFFSHRSDIIEKAIKDCTSEQVTQEDGELIGTWLLTEISLWDNEKERLVTLTSKYVLTIKYDFITMKTLDVKRVPIDQIDTLIIGELEYPSHSLIPSRNMRGLRTMWNQGQPLTFTKKWNPFTSDIPWNTYTSHPLLWHKEADEKERSVFNVDDFAYHLVQAVEKASRPTPCAIEHKPIVLENYVGVTSLIHNKNALGFFKVRGKFSF